MRYFWLMILWVSSVYSLHGQVDTLPSYYMAEGEVVLEFDLRTYNNGQQEAFKKVFEQGGTEILAAAAANEAWSKNGWRLQRINDNVYQLRKSLEAFDDAIAWEAKYMINGAYWSMPTSIAPGEPSPDFAEEVFGLGPKVAEVSENGNASFSLNGFQAAEQVILSGSFNHWDEQEIKMKKTAKGWAVKLSLPRGIYEYKFIADGGWLHDPANDLKVVNEFESFNSILLIGETVTFHLPDYLDAKAVVLSGSFNSWDESAIRMNKRADGWYVDLPLPPGKHYYKFIVDGKWTIDPKNLLQQPDNNGHWNSVLLLN